MSACCAGLGAGEPNNFDRSESAFWFENKSSFGAAFNRLKTVDRGFSRPLSVGLNDEAFVLLFLSPEEFRNGAGFLEKDQSFVPAVFIRCLSL